MQGGNFRSFPSEGPPGSRGRRVLFRVFVTISSLWENYCRCRGALIWRALQLRSSSVNNLSNPKPGHTTGGSGRSARQSRRAGSGKIGCQQNYSPKKQKSTVPSKASKKASRQRLSRSTNRRNYVYTDEGKKFAVDKQFTNKYQRFTSSFYQQGKKRALFLPAAQWNVASLSL